MARPSGCSGGGCVRLTDDRQWLLPTHPLQVPDIKGADPMAAGLLIECRGSDPAALDASMDEVRLGAAMPA